MLMLLAACSQSDHRYLIAVTIEDPAADIAAAVEYTMRPNGYRLSVESVEDPSEILASITAGTTDLGIVEEPAQMTSGVSTIAPLYPSVLHVLHLVDQQPQDFAELIRGHKIYAGPVGGAAERLLHKLAAEFGVTATDYKVLEDPWTDTAEVYFILGGLLPSDSVKRFAGYRLFSFGDPASLGRGTVAESIVLRNPQLSNFILPEQLYGELSSGPILTLSLRSVLVASTNLPQKVAYDIAAQLLEHSQELAAVYPLVTRELNEGFDGANLALPLHPGVRRYLDKDKPGFVERYVEVIALVITVFAATVSFFVGLYNRRKQAKKDRVDVYYNKMLALRQQIRPPLSAEHAATLVQQVKQVQQDVFALLVDERVDADTTLTIFLDLSNQVLRELEAPPLRQGGLVG